MLRVQWWEFILLKHFFPGCQDTTLWFPCFFFLASFSSSASFVGLSSHEPILLKFVRVFPYSLLLYTAYSGNHVSLLLQLTCTCRIAYNSYFYSRPSHRKCHICVLHCILPCTPRCFKDTSNATCPKWYLFLQIRQISYLSGSLHKLEIQ